MAEALEDFYSGKLWIVLLEHLVVLVDVISPYQAIVQRGEKVDRDVDQTVLVLVAQRLFSAVDFQVSFFVFKVEGLVPLV